MGSSVRDNLCGTFEVEQQIDQNKLVAMQPKACTANNQECRRHDVDLHFSAPFSVKRLRQVR
jgi:hypothetical protein